MARFVLFAALVASVAAFAPAPAATSLRAAATTSTQLYGYVPAGLTEAEYKKKLAEEAAKSKDNKAKFPKGKSFVDVGAWLKTMEGRQQFKSGEITRSGHTYAKQKYATKEEYDAAKGRK